MEYVKSIKELEEKMVSNQRMNQWGDLVDDKCMNEVFLLGYSSSCSEKFSRWTQVISF